MRSLCVLALVIIAMSAPLAAQQQQQTPPKTQRQVVLDKLRAMGQEQSRDTSTVPDSVRQRQQRARADSLTPRPRAAAPVDLQRDSLMLALARLQGYFLTEYRAISARFNADTGVLVLKARPDSQALVVQAGQSMTADSLLTFDRNRAIACGFGKPVLTGEGADAPVQSTQVCYNTRTKVGTALGATTRISEGANWIVAGNLTTEETDLYIDHGRFTDCTLEVPHYHFSAREVKVVNKDVLVARNVTLNFGDVPVFWLPFLMQSMKQGRRSGILMPEFSVNDIVRRNSRYNRRVSNVGFYWAASEYVGAKLSFGWFSNNWSQLEGAVDYSIASKFMSGRATWNQYWRAAGGKENTLAASNSWQPDERTSLQANVSYASSSSFIKQNSFDPRELNRSIDSNVGASRRFDWGSVSLSGSRRQYLSDNKVDLRLPTLSVNLSPITLFAATGNEHWYNNATWSADAATNFTTLRLDEQITPTGFDSDNLNASARSSFSLDRLSWSQSFELRQGTQFERRAGRTPDGDSILFRPALTEQLMSWNTGLSFQQRLIGTSTFTPGISLRGESARDTLTGLSVAAPTRLDASASVKLDVFGFWPGVGPIEQFRHRLSPTFSYSYSPAVAPDSSQRRVFGSTQIMEQNRLTIGVSQSIEGKFRGKSSEADSAAAADTLSTDPDQPRRLPQSRKLTLLSLNTDAVVYDFVAARDDFGVQTTQISNSLNSDLLRGLQLSVTHDLFNQLPLPTGAPVGTRPDREFKPHLSRVSASFSLTGSSWLFRALGLTGGPETPPATGSTPTPVPDTVQPGAGVSQAVPDFGLLGPRGQTVTATQTPRGPVGSWNASFNYTLFRPREAELNSQENQMVTANVTFQPTQNWNLTWSTGFSFTEKEFTDHVLTLTRAMHDWDANFDFLKAQNGNFSFQFRVALRANPDLKFDYQQRDNSRRQFPR